MSEEHPRSKCEFTEADRKKANKIANKMVAAFDTAVKDLNKLGSNRFAAHNYGVHMMLAAAAHAAAYNAMCDGRQPRADYWDTVCREALDRAEKQLSKRAISLVYEVLCETDTDGTWRIVPQENRP